MCLGSHIGARFTEFTVQPGVDAPLVTVT